MLFLTMGSENLKLKGSWSFLVSSLTLNRGHNSTFKSVINCSQLSGVYTEIVNIVIISYFYSVTGFYTN